MLDATPDIGRDNIAKLSRREVQVLEMTSAGMTNDEMAVRLDVTVHAVKFHLASIYRKLGVTNRTQAASVYFRSAQPAPAVPSPNGSGG